MMIALAAQNKDYISQLPLQSPGDWGMANGMWAEQGKVNMVASLLDCGMDNMLAIIEDEVGAHIPDNFMV